MEKFKAKLHKQGGFTLVEMLIVVAIIAILIAVSIPMVNSALETAREAVDSANERNARSVASIVYMTASKKSGDSDTGIGTDGGKAYYSIGSGTGASADTTTGTLVKTPANVNGDGYGQGTTAGEVEEERKGLIIEVTVTPPTDTKAEPEITIKWVSKTSS